MISPEAFARRWTCEDKDTPLLRFEPSMLEGLNIPDADRTFLIVAGLPDSAAPFLGFERPQLGVVPTVPDYCGVLDTLRAYRVIGGDGNGDFICLDETCGGAVVCVNHDDNYRAVFMNSSVPQLAESLLAYRDLVKWTIRDNGEDAFLDNDIPLKAREWLLGELRRIDAVAVEDGSFWRRELDGLDVSYAQPVVPNAL